MIEDQIKYQFKEPRFLRQALTHRSFQPTDQTTQTAQSVKIQDNETLEFLGDAVIDLAVSDLLMEYFPEDNEGQLSKRRASLVNEEALAEQAKNIGLNQVLLLGKSEQLTEGASKPRLLGSAFEALFGAVYKDGGYLEAQSLCRRFFSSILEQSQHWEDFDKDYKSRYQEVIQKTEPFTPTYRLLKIEGPPHDCLFHVAVCVGEKIIAKGWGRNKKQAEQEAARHALEGQSEL